MNEERFWNLFGAAAGGFPFPEVCFGEISLAPGLSYRMDRQYMLLKEEKSGKRGEQAPRLGRTQTVLKSYQAGSGKRVPAE